MVKGVNKTVIEVNDTGSKLFEKIVFYVSPQYGNLSSKRLEKEALLMSADFSAGRVPSLRRSRKRRLKIRAVVIGAAVVLAAVGIALCVIL